MLDISKPVTAQEVFTHVVTHLLQQRCRSILETDEEMCAYRGMDDLQCAAGCCIPDDKYEPIMEGSGIKSILGLEDRGGAFNDSEEIRKVRERQPEWRETFKHLAPHADLLNELQKIHDNEEVCIWFASLEELAEKSTLQMPEVSR